IGLPFALITLYIKSFLRNFKNYTLRFGIKEAALITGSFFTMNLVLFYWLNWNQPQEGILEKLKASAWTKEDVATFSEDKEEIREGLLNAYLGSYRYLCEENRNNNVRSLYRDVFGGKREDYEFLQSCNNVVLKPFLYSGADLWQDEVEAAKWYEKLFDSPIQKEEKAAIKNALNATSERDQVEAGLLNVGEENVLVTDQRLTITEYGDIAEVELSESYQNQTYQQQEVLYYFSLPENAVLSGLWLSDDSTVKKFAFRVSPRGAAQQVYKNEVQQRVDPSLLEQVGPGQYRLRAFPVLPKRVEYNYQTGRRRRADRTVIEGPKLHLWLSYTVMKDENGSWPLPQASQRRNVFCSEATISKMGDETIEKENDEDWLPAAIKSKPLDTKGMYGYTLSDSMYVSTSRPQLSKSDTTPASGSAAVIIDLSYSMNHVRKELEQTMQWLEEKNVKADIYLAGMSPARVNDIKFSELSYFGSVNALKMLHQFDSLSAGKKYDKAFFLTDEGSYEIGDDSLKALSLPFPLYVVHLGDKAAYAYEDNFLETIQKSGGKPVKKIADAFEDIYMKKLYKDDASFLAYENGWLWKSGTPAGKTSEGLKPLAARQYINSLVRKSAGTDLRFLDQVHFLAVSNHIVTPYSSMIVLVNTRQHEALDKAEQEQDRFKREAETGKENLTKPNSFGFGEVSGTPEPEEWLLIILAGGLLCYFAVKRKISGTAGQV
ncbi:MAG: TIGR02921 family PEP-CTERM protein, partial [Cytophagaceae bacterium]